MNRLVISLLALAIGALPILAHAADVKVGYVNIEKVLEAAPQAESARTAIEKEFAPRDRELVRFQKDLRDMAERLEKDGAIMSESERTDLAQEIRAKKRDLKRMTDEFREDLNIRRNQELGTLQRQVLEAIQALAKQQGYDLIVRDVLYYSDKMDITNQVIDRLESR